MIGEVYFVRPVGWQGPVKIGYTTLIRDRIANISLWAPFELEVLGTIAGPASLERRFHAKFVDQRERGEWFAWSEELGNVIAAVQAGTFDTEKLPLPACLPTRARPTGGCKTSYVLRDYALRGDVLAFCAKMSMPHSTFGRMAVGDPAFVRQLVQGRAPGERVSSRVRHFMATYRPAARQAAAA
jgi:hypothetical protein